MRRRALGLGSPGNPSESDVSRRDFIKVGGAAAIAASLPFVRPRRASAVTEPRVAVVGAGLAGLCAAYALRSRALVQVYEASDHVGGRTRTIRGLKQGEYAEAGGGGISSNERNLIRFARRLGLGLVDTWAGYPDGSETYYFNGQRYTWTQLRPGVRQIAIATSEAWTAIGGHIPSHDNHNAAADEYDNMSVTDFIANFTDFDASTPAGSYTTHNHAIEYGGKADVSSALELILEQGNFWGRGPYDERWAIRGGNDRLAKRLAARLPPDSINFGNRLVAIAKLIGNTYRLTFDTGGSQVDVDADHVVLAVPATALHSTKVDLSAAGISSLHMTALDRMTMGTNAKLNLQFSGRPWARRRHNGDGTTDTIIESSWQQSFFGSKAAVLVAMNNEDYSGLPAHGVMPLSELPSTLAAIDVLYPNSSAKFIDGQAYLDVWVNDSLIGGSYASSPLGSFTTYGGVEAQREGNLHFAGEHTARYQRAGTMAGAYESGIRAAKEILSS